jgi:hypothetical protein
MPFLANEVYRQRGGSIHLVFGKPIHPSRFSGNLSHRFRAVQFRMHVYGLREGRDVLGAGAQASAFM